MKYVVDASFVASLILPDETPAVDELKAQAFFQAGTVAPGLIQLELLNVLIVAKRQKRITGSQLRQLLDALYGLRMVLQPALDSRQIGDALRLAEKHQLTAYDSAYLELAIRLSLPLATLDKPLMKAASLEGITLAR